MGKLDMLPGAVSPRIHRIALWRVLRSCDGGVRIVLTPFGDGAVYTVLVKSVYQLNAA